MCGQQNKKMMSVADTVEILTEECIHLRQQLQTITNTSDKEKIVLTHIKKYSDTAIKVNDFRKGLEWFNVSNGLSITHHLTGKIVILDFFTYCCINCMHMLPDLSALEAEYSIQDGLIIIGVHSAKFSNEKESSNILSAVQRHNIIHPVVNDDNLSMWHELGVVCWPTLIILGPRAQPLFVLVGEGHRKELFTYIKVALFHFKSTMQISNHEIPLSPAHHLFTKSKNILRFPGKIETFNTTSDEKIVISDTGNHRILIVKLDGMVEYIIGGCSSGLLDGGFDEAQFNAPQGICILNSFIYVADTGNHAIRLIDLEKKIVTTEVGTGTQGHDYIGGKYGKEQALSSPWDVALYSYNQNGTNVPIVLIAMAGTHQIWALFTNDTVWWKKKEFKAGTCAAIVGSGKEENRNNVYPHAAGLAQPSGIVVAQELETAFFADSESSSIRRVHLQDGRVSTVAGGDKNPSNLHNFGDADGIKLTVKLQHPLGIAWDSSQSVLYIADTYNHKIKIINPAGKCKTLCGDNKPYKNHTFDEPSGLTVSTQSNALFIADTNNHCIKILNKHDQSITTFPINFQMFTERTVSKSFNFITELSNDDSKLTISLVIDSTTELKLAPDAPQTWTLISLPTTWNADHSTGPIASFIVINIPQEDTQAKIIIRLNIIACNADKCIPKSFDVIFHVNRKLGAPNFAEECKNLKLI